MGKRNVRVAALTAVPMVALAAPALADHSWGTYHWQRTSAVISPPVVTAITANWQANVDEAVDDWNGADVDQIYDDYIESDGPAAAPGVNPKNCRAISGKILVCNAKYGFNGWLGVAQIWLSGGHIVQGTTKLNDSYFNTATYNTYEWKQLVTCQEIGHDYGLGHQDENFGTDATESCMDYTDRPAGNTSPDKHDYEQLAKIYGHSHSNFTAVSPGKAGSSAGRPAAALNGAEGGNTPAEWGRAVDSDAHGRPHLFVQDLGNGNRKITHVFWAVGEGPKGQQHDDH